MYRKNTERIAVASGVSTIHVPAAAWRFYLGGSLTPDAQWAEDVNGDGVTEFIFIAGGKLIAKLPDDTIVWDSLLLDLRRIEKVGDIDGNGGIEIVAVATGGRIVIIAGTDGSLLYELPQGIFGNYIGAVRWADFNGDGLDDMYVADMACGSVGSLGDVAVAFSFAEGGASSPRELFRLERGRRDYVCGNNDAIGDFDGDGVLEVLALGLRRFYLYSTVDGSFESQSLDLGSLPYGRAVTDVRDVDGDGADEVLCYTDNPYDVSINSRRVFLVGWNGTALEKRWEMSVRDLVADRHNFVHNGMTDLDGDGRLEVVTSFYEHAIGMDSTYVLDAATGLVLDTLRNERLAGVVDVDGDGLDEVMTVDADLNLSCYKFTAGSLSLFWSASNLTPVYSLDPVRRSKQSAQLVPLAPDLDGDTIAEVVVTVSSGGHVVEVQTLNAEAAPPTVYGSYLLGSERVPLTFQLFEDITERGIQVTMARSDGYLIIFDRAFRSINDPSEVQGGLRIGGYYSGWAGFGSVPVAADLEGDGDIEIVARDSRGTLLGLDPRGASLVRPPSVLWERPQEKAPTIVDMDGDGRKEIVTQVGGYGTSMVRVVEDDGARIFWERSVGNRSQAIVYDTIPAEVTGDRVKDLFYQLFDRGTGDAVIGMLDGRTGADLWPAPYITRVAGSGYGGSSFWDVTGDGRPDPLVCVRNLVVSLNALNGAQISSANADYCSYPGVVDIDSDGTREIVSVGSLTAPRAFELNLTPIWIAQATQGRRFVWMFGSFADCPTGKLFIQPVHLAPILMIWNAATGGLVREVVLAEGGLYGTVDDATAEGKRTGFLGSVTVKEDLTGTGVTAAIVGSTDGYLYAVDPCEGTLIWAMNFRFPVGEAVFADTDYDGIDEIIVTVADGYLYGIDREILPAPRWVYDTDPPSGITAEDVDSIETRDTLYAAWEPVEHATSYEYAVLTSGGSFVTVPNFINVGLATSVFHTAPSLSLGGRYFFAVRAIGAAGNSSEAISDGVTIVDETPPTIMIEALPNPFSPDGDGVEDTVELIIRMTDRRGLRFYTLAIVDGAGTTVRDFGERPARSTDFLDYVEWDGRDDGGAIVMEGIYEVVGRVTDEVGHVTEGRETIRVVITPESEEPLVEVYEEVADLPPEEVEPLPEEAGPDAEVADEDASDVEGDLPDAAEGEVEPQAGAGCSCRIAF